MAAVFVAFCIALSLVPPERELPMVRNQGVAHPGDPVRLLERLRAGNIDQSGTEAHNRWGPGYDAGLVASDRKFR